MARGRGQGREQLARAAPGGCARDPLPGPALPCLCGGKVCGFGPVLATARALPAALWIPQTGRNDTKHFGDNVAVCS